MILLKKRHFQKLEWLWEGKELLKVKGADSGVSEMTEKKTFWELEETVQFASFQKARLNLGYSLTKNVLEKQLNQLLQGHNGQGDICL